MDDLKVYYTNHEGEEDTIEVIFGRIKDKTSQKAVYRIDGTLLSNTGFSLVDLCFFSTFVTNNARCILMDIRGEF